MIGSTFRLGGGQPSSVVIHATYKHRTTGHIWVEHFVSDDIEREVGTVEEKFHQAAAKLVAAATRRPAEFGSNDALDAYAEHVRSHHYPGLGGNKRHQIHHHIALNHQILVGEL